MVELPLPHPALALGYRASTDKKITTDRIETAMAMLGNLIAEDDERYLSIFRRLERELEERRAMERSLRRALSMASRNGDA